jgi:hypothetical protein
MSTTLATKRAVGYLRVSSTGQTGERHSSLDTQKARAEWGDRCFEISDLEGDVISFAELLKH